MWARGARARLTLHLAGPSSGWVVMSRAGHPAQRRPLSNCRDRRYASLTLMLQGRRPRRLAGQAVYQMLGYCPAEQVVAVSGAQAVTLAPSWVNAKPACPCARSPARRPPTAPTGALSIYFVSVMHRLADPLTVLAAGATAGYVICGDA